MAIDTDPIVVTDAGTLQGSWRGTSAAFLGVPFAEPLVGERRFQAPLRAPRFTDTFSARSYGATAQRQTLGAVTTIPEPSIAGDSALNVNIFTPAPGDTSARMPVLVWIHGGGYIAGSPASPWYDGKAFNANGIVSVTISYRLGMDGFGWVADAPANRALLDARMALEWVHDNIASFGGDPDSVTIAGQSAGGGMVLSLLTMPSAAGLFRAAISQSGAPSFRSFDDHERVGRQLAATIGIQPTAEEWARVPIDALLARQAALMMAWDRPELPPHPLLGSLGLALADGEAAFLPFSPVYGDETLPDNLYSAIENGVASTIPVLLGSNADEFVGDAPYMTDADIRHWASAINAGASRTAELIALHAGGERDPFGRMMTDLFFRAPIAEIVSRRRSTASATWTYDFRWTGPGGLASHCLELPFTWNNLQAEGVSAALGSTPPQALADSMHGALCSFIAGGAAPWAMDSSSGATRVWDNSGARDGSSPYRSTHPLILPKG